LTSLVNALENIQLFLSMRRTLHLELL